MANPAKVTRFPHQMIRVDVATGTAFDDFRDAFEAAVPAVDVAAATEQFASATWGEITAWTEALAPNEFLRYATLPVTEVMSRAGHTDKSVIYLVGNHVIAERMFRHDPRAMLYAPLRVLLFSDADGNAVIAMDQPSTAFASLDIDEVTDVGQSLDDKVVVLLKVVGVSEPAFEKPS